MFRVRISGTTIVISGAARGVDSYAATAARLFDLTLIEHPADWKLHGRAAGAIRNKVVVDQADRVVAFWDGESPGTYDALKQARRAGKPFQVYTVARRVLV